MMESKREVVHLALMETTWPDAPHIGRWSYTLGDYAGECSQLYPTADACDAALEELMPKARWDRRVVVCCKVHHESADVDVVTDYSIADGEVIGVHRVEPGGWLRKVQQLLESAVNADLAETEVRRQMLQSARWPRAATIAKFLYTTDGEQALWFANADRTRFASASPHHAHNVMGRAVTTWHENGDVDTHVWMPKPSLQFWVTGMVLFVKVNYDLDPVSREEVMACITAPE